MQGMNWLHRTWKRIPHYVRKPFIFVLGFAIVGVGIILLPLPGPGWVIIFAGFAILATEFVFAMRVRDRLVHLLKLLIALGKKWWQAISRAFKRWRQT
jgi:uncharacterized protein (TIGR02611 family)